MQDNQTQNTIYWMQDEERPRLFVRRTSCTVSKKRKGVTKSCANLSCFIDGAPQTIRTSDLFLRREALYPAELEVLKP
ncbi:MAG: hypothetical protein QG668_466 [Patescibacteria group bacterium]|jgi:hypothetical protein|nr:hypothetical protein [Patescibacteria group bacterium]